MANVLPPLTLDIANSDWSQPLTEHYDAIFTANTCYIISWPQAQNIFIEVGRVLTAGGHFWTYGPFNVEGQCTSLSNAAFDTRLKEYAAHMASATWPN
ncbi:MAG: DUF938 domain-containing protein [Glaciimonas sp.]|nr:DUF938 domain-containing protein [Glaciimonas sp.]